MLSMDHEVDFVMMYRTLLRVDVNLMDELEMLNTAQWNVDGDNQYSSDDNLLMVDEKNHRHLIVAAKKTMSFSFLC